MSCVKICAVRATQNITIFLRDCSGCMFRHHVAGLPSACLQAPDTSGCARAWIYFALRPAVFKGKRCEEQYVITYITNVTSLCGVTIVYHGSTLLLPYTTVAHAQPQ